MKQRKKPFSCIIVGRSTLPIRCAEVLKAAGHTINAIASADPAVKNWANDHGISCLTPGPGLAERVPGPFDYLFSIVNEHILRDDILRLAGKMAINYHDAPLPRYAGSYATSWALINREKTHGITWHVISDVVDAGDILVQRPVEISPDDTAYTLNTKCYEAAISAFTTLVDQLASGTATATPQNLDDRTYYARAQRPPRAGVISWSDTAEDISALVRGLNFGPHPNPLGVAKLAIGDEFFIIPELDVLGQVSEAAPGTITRLTDRLLQISAADREVVIRRVLALNGDAIELSDLIDEHDLHAGFRFEETDPELTRKLADQYSLASKQEKYWVDRLAHLEPAIPPFAHRGQDTSSDRYARVFVRLPNSVFKFLREKHPEFKVDVFLLSAFAVLLARLGGSDDFDIGYADRRIRLKPGVLGALFAPRLPMRISIDRLQTITSLYEALHAQLKLIGEHGTYALDVAARYPSVGVEAGTRLPVGFEKVGSLRGSELIPREELALLVSERSRECIWIYDRDIIEDDKVEDLVRYFRQLLDGIVADPECKIAYLPILSEREREQLLVKWNDTRADYPKDKCFHQLFEEQVDRTPRAVAATFQDKHLTYAELNARSNQVANFLRKRGAGPDVIVGICLERSLEMMVALLGIFKAGAAYLPLDPTHNRERIAFMLADAEAPIVITHSNFEEIFSPHAINTICLDSNWGGISQEAKANPEFDVSPSNLAYVIYTSGTTGKPKGTVIGHLSLTNFLVWFNEAIGRRVSPMPVITSLAFDMSLKQVFAPLLRGDEVWLQREEAILDPSNLILELDRKGAVGINIVPSLWRAILDQLDSPGQSVRPSTLRHLIFGGEAVTRDLISRSWAALPELEIWNLYGPTEATSIACGTRIDRTQPITIGRPIANAEAYILDAFRQPVPVGTPGELYLGGDGLALGYLGQTDLTKDRFVAHPFRENGAARLYKTGDLVRYFSDGQIEYLGRIDNQVKIRGLRIELTEIEAVLAEHDAVREAVVIATDDEYDDRQLVAYVVPRDGHAMHGSALREYLNQKLPRYMLPSAFVEIAEVPLTPNGKIDRKNLPAPSQLNSQFNEDFVAPRDELESRLVNIWESILGVRSIGVNDNFFELGGHSLKAIRMFAEVEETFGKNIPLATLFEARTISKLARILRQDGWAAPESSMVPIQPNGSRPPFFCIHARGGNVLFYRDLAKYMGPNQPFYGIQARRLAGRQLGHATVEEMAEFYINEIRTVQPAGPYYLGGSSFGGLAAFEIAQQLHRQGEKVALLALLDTGTPDYPKMLPTTTALWSKIYAWTRLVQHHRDSLMAFDTRGKASYILEKLKKGKLQYTRRIRNTYKKAARRVFIKLGGPGSIPKSYIQIEDQIGRAARIYVPKPYPGKMTLFRASNQPLGIHPDPALGWGPLVDGGLEIHEVPGHHGSIVAEPYVRTLAQKITACIDRAQLNGNGNGSEAPRSKRRKPRKHELFEIADLKSIR